MQRPKNQSRRAFLKGLVLAGGGAVLGTAVVRSHKRSKKMMAELAELERKRKIRDVEHAKKMAELEANSKRELEAWRIKTEKERAVAKLKPKLNIKSVLLGDVPEQNRLSHETFHGELMRFKSPLADPKISKRLYDYCTKQNLDYAYFLAKSRIESHHGTDEKNRLNKNVGNLRARKGEKADAKGFRVFASFEEGAKAMIDRLVSKTYIGGGKTTVETIEFKYAPPIENSTNQNIRVLHEIKNQLYKKEADQKKKSQKRPNPSRSYRLGDEYAKQQTSRRKQV